MGDFMRTKWMMFGFVAGALTAGLPAGQAAAQAATNFYQGKTITVVIGSGVGGGYDVYGRLLAQFLGKHIPGNPRFIVENRPGASTRTATTYVSKIAPKDGTVIGNSVNTLPFDQFLYPSEKREYD
jgi:tripartite-type tricarboxylate transporter receptor subunit TctC